MQVCVHAIYRVGRWYLFGCLKLLRFFVVLVSVRCLLWCVGWWGVQLVGWGGDQSVGFFIGFYFFVG